VEISGTSRRRKRFSAEGTVNWGRETGPLYRGI